MEFQPGVDPELIRIQGLGYEIDPTRELSCLTKEQQITAERISEDDIWRLTAIFGGAKRALTITTIYVDPRDPFQVDMLILLFEETGQTWWPKQKGESHHKFRERSEQPLRLLGELKKIFYRDQLESGHIATIERTGDLDRKRIKAGRAHRIGNNNIY